MSSLTIQHSFSCFSHTVDRESTTTDNGFSHDSGTAPKENLASRLLGDLALSFESTGMSLMRENHSD